MLRPCLGSLALIGDVSLGDRTGEFKAYVQEVALLAADQPWLHIGITWAASKITDGPWHV